MTLIGEAIKVFQQYDVKINKVTPISIRANEFIVIEDENGLIVSFHVAAKPELAAYITLMLSQKLSFNLRITDSYYVNSKGIKFIGEFAHNEYIREGKEVITRYVSQQIEIETVRDKMMMDDSFGIKT